jgi:NAD(P)-dependent dehydrogenase (short-subunit alcohol dehydrogenase family)
MNNGKRCAIVTGAARGIGRGISLSLAEHGYTVAAVGTRPADAVAEYTDALCRLSPESFYIQGDISSHEDRLRIADEAFRGLGEVDVLVNNAGVAPKVRAGSPSFFADPCKNATGAIFAPRTTCCCLRNTNDSPCLI